VEHNKHISAEQRIIFLESVKTYSSIFIYYLKGCTSYVLQVWL